MRRFRTSWLVALFVGLACSHGSHSEQPAPFTTFVNACVALSWDSPPPLLEGWAIPDTLRFDPPAWLAAVPDTQGVTGGLVGLAYPTPPNEATWTMNQERLELWFRTVYGYRRLTFPNASPFAKAQWQQGVEFDYRVSGKVTGRRVGCPPAAS